MDLQLTPEMSRWIVPGGMIFGGICLSLLVIYIASFWLILTKAGRSGWLIFIPLVNVLVLIRIAKKPLWYFLLFLIPPVTIVVLILFWIGLAKAFGKSTLFGLGLIFFTWIFVIILAFGRSEYQSVDLRKSKLDEFTPLNIRPS